MRIISVTRSEFELENGKIFPIDPPLNSDMTPEEFQEHYDYAASIINSREGIGRDDANTSVVGQVRED